MTTKVEPTVEKWEKILKKAEKYIRGNAVYYGNDQYRLSMTDWLYFIKGVANEIESHSLQEAKAEERAKLLNTDLFDLAEKVRESIKVVTGYNQILAEQNKKELAQRIMILLAYIEGLEASLKQEEEV